MVRVFISTSHISSVYMTLYARATHLPEHKDVLLVDVGTRRQEVIRLIEEVSTFHDWSLFRSFSAEAPEGHRYEPGLRKRLTRRWKGLPLVRDLYNLLLDLFQSGRNARYRSALVELLAPLASPKDTLQVHAHTETYLRIPMLQAFPNSTCDFFEHGQGDYIHVLDGHLPLGRLHALFAAPYRRFLEQRGWSSEWVIDLQGSAGFAELSERLLVRHGVGPVDHMVTGPVVLILLEALDMYHVSEAFWGAYIDHVVSYLGSPYDYHFILKPHPSQSAHSLKLTEERCGELGLNYTLLNTARQSSMAVEVDFARWAARTHHVFCLVSTGCFYLSQLYRAPHIHYHYSTSFMEKWIRSAPPQFRQLFEKMKPLISEVLSERCQPY